jgi:hypothetical protein
VEKLDQLETLVQRVKLELLELLAQVEKLDQLETLVQRVKLELLELVEQQVKLEPQVKLE